MKKFVVILFILILSGCGVRKPQPDSQRIISLNPAATEILFALGSKNVVGVSESCNYPPEAVKLPKMGGAWTPYVEQIAAARPSIVFVIENSSAKSRLENLGVKVVEVPDAYDFNRLMDNIDLIGHSVNLETGALKSKIARDMDAAAVKLNKTPRVFVVIDNGLWTAGGDTFINFLITAAGGENIFGLKQTPYSMVSWEAVVEENPDIIISLVPGGEDFSKRLLAAKINAVKNGRIYTLTQKEIDIVSRPGPRTPEAVSILNRIFLRAEQTQK